MSLPSTRSLEAFVAAARLGSLAAAGVELGMSVPALSRRLSALERLLGVRLLDRLPHGVAPTAAGSRYLAHAAAILDRLKAASAELRRDGKIVRVTTIPAFATRWLIPRLSAFTRLHPGIEVDVRTSVAFEHLERGDFDLAVRLARDSDVSATPLFPVHLFPVWRSGGPFIIDRPSDVLRYPLMGPDHRPEFWREWMTAVGLADAAEQTRGVDALLLYEHAMGDAGVAIGIEPLVSGLLADGRLSGLETHRVRSTRSFHLLESTAPRSPAARLFARWLRSVANVEGPEE